MLGYQKNKGCFNNNLNMNSAVVPATNPYKEEPNVGAPISYSQNKANIMVGILGTGNKYTPFN
jgi:hypothetical protein